MARAEPSTSGGRRTPAATRRATRAAPGPAEEPVGAPAPAASPGPASIEYLAGRLGILEWQVRRALQRRRAHDPAVDDAFRGLHLTEDDIDALLDPERPPIAHAGDAAEAALALSSVSERAEQAERSGGEVRLRRLAERFSLSPDEVEILVAALAPDVDSRFERFYGYLNDDVTRRRATVGLALELAGHSTFDAAHRTALSGNGTLVRTGLVAVEEPERPFLTRLVSVPDRVTSYCLGGDEPDALLAGVLVRPDSLAWSGDPDSVARLVSRGQQTVYVHEQPGGGGVGLALEGLRRAGMSALVLDLGRLSLEHDADETARVAVREARLSGRGIVAGPVALPGVPAAGTAGHVATPAGVRVLAEGGATLVLVGSPPFDPGWSRQLVAVVEAPAVGPARLAEMWSDAFARSTAPLAEGLDAAAVTSHLRLSPDRLSRAAEAAELEAVQAGTEVDAGSIRAGARRQNAAGLERFARRIEPEATWDDLVLRRFVLTGLRSVAARARFRTRVLGEWRMRPGGGRGDGVSVLFAGESGTGKTMSAEVVAGDLGLDLYAINLATVVDKYVGETEKNLERIFAEVSGVNAVLLFDEADALFGKRSEVRDAHDRYANVETAYLLQRLESFDGLAILTTNLRTSIDEAFSRRLDAVVEFPRPDEAERLRLWDQCLGLAVPRSTDLDLDFMANSFDLAGGNIRSIAVTAGYAAAASEQPITMEVLIAATASEYRKLGRLCVETEFGPWYPLVADVHD